MTTSPAVPPPAPVAAPLPGWARAGIGVILGLAGWFYLWTATSAGNPLSLELQTHDLYNRLADGFLAGRASFVESAPPELAQLSDPYDPAQNAPYRRYHDVSYRDGRYYLYFGPAPALVLLAPWRALTGTYLPQHLAAAVFAAGAALVGAWMVCALRRRWFPGAPAGLALAGVLVIALGSLLPVLLRRPVYYELAIAAACFFGLSALAALWRASESSRRRGWLIVAGLALGLAVASRPNYLFGVAAVLAWLGWRWHREPADGRKRWAQRGADVVALLAPLALCGLALMAYNYARFGSITEFGTSFMLAGSNQSGVSQFGLRYLPINLYYHFFALPHIGAYFPFVLVTGFPPFSPPEGYGGQENMYGILVTLPILAAAGWCWRARTSPVAEWLLPPLALAAGNLLSLLLLMGAANRYQLDYVPSLMIAASGGLFLAHQTLAGWRRAVWTAFVAIATLGTVLFNLLVSLQHNDLLRHHNPGTYAGLARRANGLTAPFLSREELAGALEFTVLLPGGRTGQVEPLVVTGVSFRADFIYIFYKDERHIQIGFEHTSYGGPLSAPVRVDYAVPVKVRVEMGSLLPPREHPYWDGVPAPERESRKRRLRVAIDGREVLTGEFDFYDASPGHVTVGRNPISDAFGRRFTGSVRDVRRVPLAP